MTPYTYRCPLHGDFAVQEPFGEARERYGCPSISDEDQALLQRARSVLIESGELKPLDTFRFVTPPSFCGYPSDRVFDGNLGFAQGRSVFHDGIEGDGQTNREWGERTRREFKERTGREAVPVGARWI